MSLNRKRACRRKLRHTNPVTALQELLRMASDGREHVGLGVYLCHCGGFHLGHLRPRRTAKKQKRHHFKLFRLLAKRSQADISAGRLHDHDDVEKELG